MIATIMMRARALAAASWWDLVPLKTHQSPYAAVMATAAFDFHCRVAMGGTKDNNTKYGEEQY